MEGYNKKTGDFGEKKATVYLKHRGYRILERNYRAGRSGEIDIIARAPDGVITFVEVKTRTGTSMGDPRDAVNYYKKKHIINTALTYISRKNLYDEDARFDVIEVTFEKHGLIRGVRINHIKEAFEVNDV